MDTKHKVLLVGCSALTVVTEAALSVSPNLELRVTDSPFAEVCPCDAVVAVDRLDEDQLAALARLYPSTPILSLDWERGTFSWFIKVSGLALNTDHLLKAVFGYLEKPDITDQRRDR